MTAMEKTTHDTDREMNESNSKTPRQFVRRSYLNERSNIIFQKALRFLFDAAEEIPTVYIDDAQKSVIAVYGQSGLVLDFSIVEQSLRVSLKFGKANRFVAPSIDEVMAFLTELEGHRQRTCTPLMRHPNRHAARLGASAKFC